MRTTQLVVMTVTSLGICLLMTNFIGILKMRLDTVARNQKQDAEIFSNVITQRLEDEVQSIKAYMGSPWWLETVKKANLRYVGWEPQTIQEYMTRMDEQWIPASKDAPQVQERLASPMSQRLIKLTKEDNAIAEFFLTDRYGGLIAASGKTSDFYQADELWWQHAYDNGSGDIFLGEVELDRSAMKMASAIAVPFKDETGQVIGIAKTLLDLTSFFQPLAGYSLGKTGNVQLLDGQGVVVFHHALTPMSKSDFSSFELERMLKSPGAVLFSARGGFKTKFLASAAKIKSPWLELNGIHWIVVTSQNENEILKPLFVVFVISLITGLIVLFFAIHIIKKFVRIAFISPLGKIAKAAENFADGKLDFRLDLTTGDEFEQVAASLNKMSTRLQQSMISRDHLFLEVQRREAAERLAQENKKRFFDVFYASKDATLLIDGNKFVDANDATARMLGYDTREKFLMKHPSELSPPTQPDGRSSFEKADALMSLAFEKGFHQFEWIHRKASGEDFPVMVSLTPITLQNKQILHCVWINLTRQREDERLLLAYQRRLTEQARDLALSLEESRTSREILSSMLDDNNKVREALEKSLTELETAQSLLAHAEKMEAIGRMASGVAHEVKNPLGIILQGINYFEGALPQGETDQHKMLQMMKNSVKRADKIVRGLLDFSRAQEANLELQDINALIQSSLELVQHKLKLNSVELVCDLAGNLPLALVDRGKIEQVFINLFNNAIDAMPSGGKLSIRSYLPELKAADDKVENKVNTILRSGIKIIVVEIEDTGTGVHESIMAKIFDPFFTTKNRAEGTGLGLAVAKSIMEMHDGVIDIESKKGEGAKFVLAFKIPPGERS